MVQNFGGLVSDDREPGFQKTWRFLYTMFGRHYRFDVRKRAENNPSLSKIDIVEQEGMMDKLYATAYAYLYKSPILEMCDEAFTNYIELIRCHDWQTGANNSEDSMSAAERRILLYHSTPKPEEELPEVEINTCKRELTPVG